MFQKPRQKIMLAVGYALLIYASLPIVRPISNELRERNLLRLTIYSTCALTVVALAYLVIYARKANVLKTLVVFSLFGAIYAFAFSLVPLPEERVHFIEYGILPALWVWAFAHRLKGWRLYAAAALVSSLIGVGDECIQGLLPSRYFEIKDIALNTVGSLIGTAASFSVQRLTLRHRRR